MAKVPASRFLCVDRPHVPGAITHNISWMLDWLVFFPVSPQEVMDIKTGVFVLLILCRLIVNIAAHPRGTFKRGECWDVRRVRRAGKSYM